MNPVQRRIEAARAYAGIKSQDKLAAAIGMAPATFQRRLRGQYAWRRGDLLAIAESCEVPLWFLERGFDVEVLGGTDGATSRGRAPADEVGLGEDLLGEGRDDAGDERGRA